MIRGKIVIDYKSETASSIHLEIKGVIVCGVCNEPIRDFKDDLGLFYKMDHFDNYIAHCRWCHGPLTGDR